mgnify:CR=1 FL=1
MRKLLISIDGHSAARMQSAITEAIGIYRQDPVDVFLLSVQPAVSGHVAMFFDAGELYEIQQQSANEELAPAMALLDLAGVPYTSSVVVGRHAESIARRARELGCDRIVIGRDDSEGFAGRIFGGLVGQVRHLVGVTGDCQVLGS